MQTRIQLINFALDQAQLDSSFQAKARQWLNIITETLTDNFNYPFYKATNTQAFTNSSTYTLPTNFKKADEIYMINTDGTRSQKIPVMDLYKFNQFLNNISGLPTVAMIDLPNNNIVFNAIPTDFTKSFELFYYKHPSQYSLDATDDNVIPDFLDQQSLMQELIKYAYENRDDERYMQKKAEAQEVSTKFQRNMYQSDDVGEIPLNTLYFRPTARRWRLRGFR